MRASVWFLFGSLPFLPLVFIQGDTWNAARIAGIALILASLTFETAHQIRVAPLVEGPDLSWLDEMDGVGHRTEDAPQQRGDIFAEPTQENRDRVRSLLGVGKAS
jgi:hypothetical protein